MINSSSRSVPPSRSRSAAVRSSIGRFVEGPPSRLGAQSVGLLRPERDTVAGRVRCEAARQPAAHREETLAEIGLYELRRSRNQSPIDLASILEISQSAISQIERGEDLKVSTLRTYVEGLGAHLTLIATFDTTNEETSVPIRIGTHTHS